MGEQIPGIPFKSTINKSDFTFDWNKYGKELEQSLFFNFHKQKTKNEDDEIKQKVFELQSKLKPEVPKLSDEFVEKVVRLAGKVKCKPEDLLAIMYHESGGWNPAITAKNKNGEILYGGLIQMNRQSLKIISTQYSDSLNLKSNISMEEYLKLSREKQLDYAEGYFILMKDSCNLEKKDALTAGETWGMLKSPRLTKAHNNKFLQKLSRHVDRIKMKIFKEEVHSIDVKN